MTGHPNFKTSSAFAGRPAHSVRGVLGNAAFIRSWAGRRLKTSALFSDRSAVAGRADAGATSEPNSSSAAVAQVNHSSDDPRPIAARRE
jgi:hypothetical protein